MLTLEQVGNRCRRYRKKVLKKELREVATDTGYSRENVSAFENGRNDNCIFLLWYMSRGMTYSQVEGVDPIE